LLTLCLSGTAIFAQQRRSISGTVTDSAGHGIPGISITVKGTKTTTLSDNSGKFNVPVTSSSDVLRLTSIGYEPAEVIVGNSSDLSIPMRSQANTMNEVVVTAMGIKKEQRKLGYATSTISSQEIIKTSPTN